MADYSGGIDEPTPEKCDPKRLNHAVLIVGYNVYGTFLFFHPISYTFPFQDTRPSVKRFLSIVG